MGSHEVVRVYRTALAFSLAAFCGASPALAASTPIKWHDALRQKVDWYGSSEAVRIADNVVLYQRDSGGWPKNIDMAAILTQPERAALVREKQADDSTINHGGTCTSFV